MKTRLAQCEHTQGAVSFCHARDFEASREKRGRGSNIAIEPQKQICKSPAYSQGKYAYEFQIDSVLPHGLCDVHSSLSVME